MNLMKEGFFAQRLLTWFEQNGRHDLPWQHPRTPYRVWVSEVMLQQTQVRTVIGYFNRFIEHFPDLRALAEANIDEVLAQWSGLGYYARARNLHRAARICVERFAAELPNTQIDLQTLPGIGQTTAAAIMAQAFQTRAVILDGNVKRVLARFHAIDQPLNQKAIESALWQLADAHTPSARSADYTQAIMDMGASVCTPRRPQCGGCPVQSECLAFINSRCNELPIKKTKKTRPEREGFFLIARDQAHNIWLERRPPVGIWGGLFCFPQFDDLGSVRTHLQIFGISDSQDRLHALEPILHDFTHFRLRLNPLLIDTELELRGASENDSGAWFTRKQAQKMGLPKPIRVIIDSLKNV